VIDNAPTSPEIERILIVRLSAMGDVIHTIPAVEALRNAFPQATVGWLIEERWSDLLCAPGAPRRGPRSEQRPLVDWVHTVKLREWKNSLLTLPTIQQIARVWNDVRETRYDIAVDLQGAMRSAILARWSGASTVWGAAQPRESPASMWYTHPVITRGAHVVEQNISIAEAIAQRRTRTPPIELPRDPHSEARVQSSLAEARIRDFAILNPGAGWGAKRWPPERYGAVASALHDFGICSVVNYGPGEEELAHATERASAGAAVPLKSSISELVALTRRARLFIGGDTGPMHLAAGLRVPVVAIFGPTDPARNGPYATRSIVLRSSTSLTSHSRRSQPEEGLLEITADAVAQAARELLADSTESLHA